MISEKKYVLKSLPENGIIKVGENNNVSGRIKFIVSDNTKKNADDRLFNRPVNIFSFRISCQKKRKRNTTVYTDRKAALHINYPSSGSPNE